MPKRGGGGYRREDEGLRLRDCEWLYEALGRKIGVKKRPLLYDLLRDSQEIGKQPARFQKRGVIGGMGGSRSWGEGGEGRPEEKKGNKKRNVDRPFAEIAALGIMMRVVKSSRFKTNRGK